MAAFDRCNLNHILQDGERPPSLRLSPQRRPTGNATKSVKLNRNRRKVISTPPSTYREAVDRLLGCAALFHGADTLADVADLDFAVLLQESGVDEVAAKISLAEPVTTMRSEMQVGAEISAAFETLGERDRMIAIQRTFARHPVKLAELGVTFGVSRERARQLEVRLRSIVESRIADALARAVRWLQVSVGSAASPTRFARVMNVLTTGAASEWNRVVEVAIMKEGGYKLLDGVVGDEVYRRQVDLAVSLAPRFANPAGVVNEEGLLNAIREASESEIVEWESLVRNAGMVRLERHLALRDTRRARVYVGLAKLGKPGTRDMIAEISNLPNNSSLSSVLSSDPLFVRQTKDRWGLREWTNAPYEGVVEEIVKRIEREGGEVSVATLLAEIPTQFDVLPATVKNYLATRKFAIKGGRVSLVTKPVASPQELGAARDIVWTEDGKPALKIAVNSQHLRGHSQKVSRAVAQHFGVGLDESSTVPFTHPRGVRAASVIWRSYDPTGPEMGCLREALTKAGAKAGVPAYLELGKNTLTVLPEGVKVTSKRPESA